MKLMIPKDYFSNPVPPRLFLCTTNKKIIGELPAYETSGDFKWGAYSELNFSIDRQYTDLLTGENKIHPLFDRAEGLRIVYAENIGNFIIQDPDFTSSDKDTKNITAFSLEYASGSKYLENFYVNTGEVDSKEVTYLASIYGENYSMSEEDLRYKLAVSGGYDSYESYYIKEYSDNDSYAYTQIQIVDETSYQTHFGNGLNAGIPLYIKKYPNVRFYWPTKKELSLLHLVFESIPEWRIGHVDTSLWHKERKFDEERIAVYDFLMNEVQDTFKCVVVWNTLNNTVDFYEEAEDDINEDNTIQARWETDVYISKENLANEIKISYSTDDIKTKLKVSGSDDLEIREVNLGKNYILNLDYYHNLEWMDRDLYDAYQKYLDAVEEYTPQYTQSLQGWVAANNRWNDLMHAVPAQGGVILIGDEFEKLYCIYTPINTAYYKGVVTDYTLSTDTLYSDEECTTPINKTSLSDGKAFLVQGYVFNYDKSTGLFYNTENLIISNSLPELKKWLEVYHVNQDIKADKSDNVLLILRNKDSDKATIRIYNGSQADTEEEKVANPEYKIQVVILRANSGLTDDPDEYDLIEWLRGDLTAEKMALEGFTVSMIGTMGAYFVLVKDEKQKENLEDYGVYLLREKHETYTTIFQAQTESMFSQEGYQCVAQDTAPTGEAEGARWLDTDSSPVKLYIYTKGKWVEADDNDLMHGENYIRYKENYDKLKAVQEVLVEKEREAEYCLDGFAVPQMSVDPNTITTSEQLYAAIEHHLGKTPNLNYFKEISFDETIPLLTFSSQETGGDEKVMAVYIKGTTPYISYANSRGIHQVKMDKISRLTELEEFFTDEQWVALSPLIREDEFNDDNFLLTGYESEEERIEICQELRKEADKEIKTLSQPSLEFSMDMANILALPEFAPLINQFQLGNFVRVPIRDGYVKRARLLEVHLQFDDLSDFSCDFGNLVTTKSEIDRHADLLKQAVTAGKQVASAAGNWQKAVDKSNKLEIEITNGLQNAALEVGKASGQSIVWDQFGIWGRKLIDGTTDQYEDEQFRIINNKLVFSNDGFQTSKAVFGKYIINGEERWGPLAECVTAGYIQGSIIEGGSLKIGGTGGTFIVNEDGSVEILGPDQETPVYVSKDDLTSSLQYRIELVYSGSTVFSEPNSSCTITCKVYHGNEDVTESVIAAKGTFSWIRNSNTNDTSWNNAHANSASNIITITNDDVSINAQFSCEVKFDDSKI